MRKPRTTLKLRMAIDAATRLVMLTEDWPLSNVYPRDLEHSPQFDQDTLIALLEEARDVWKPLWSEPDDTVPEEVTDVDVQAP